MAWHSSLNLYLTVGVSNGLCEHLRAREQCVYFIRAQTVIKLVLSLKITDGEQRELRKFTVCRNLSFIERTIGAIPVQPIPAAYSQSCLMKSSEHFVNLTHATGQITRATDNNCIAKTYFNLISSTQIVSISKLNLNRKDHSIPLQLSGRTALKAAKKKRTAKQAYLQSEIIIGEGQVEKRGSAN